MSSLSPETTISHYKIKGLIGSGGMGEVYKAVDLELGRMVALKTILPLRAADPNIYQRFLREARAASILTHPSICTIYEIGREGDLTFIAMQYLEGKTLQTILSDFGPPAIEITVKYALDVVEALEEAHRNGVIHRDIKPANILANERNTAVVLDFGLAKQVSFADGLNEEAATQMQITSATSLVGTGPYMPPEQIMGQPLDARSDIFSFGVTLYEMLTGARPFEGKHSIDVFHSILHDEPKPINELRDEVDESLAVIVGKALKKERNERYQSASEMRADLLGFIQAKGYAFRGLSGSLSHSFPIGVSRPGLPTREVQTATGPMTGRHAFLWPAVVLLAVVALIVSAWWIFRSRDRSDSDLVSSLRHEQLVNWRSEPGESYIRSSLSRDGTMIAYSASRDGSTDVWVKQVIGGGNALKIAEKGQDPIWSPDSQRIAFVATRNNETGIWGIPALGGSPALIKVVEKGFAPELVSWSALRPFIYYRANSNLFAVNIQSGQIEQITNFDSAHDAQDFRLSPDEDRVSYVDQKDGQTDIWFVPRAGGAAVRVTNDAAEKKNPVWHPDGKRIIYSSVLDDIYQIFVGNVAGGKPLQITFGENDSFVSSVSADGKKILYSSPREESDIWGVKTETGEEFEVTATAGVELWPDISPDNQTLAFQVTKQSQGRSLEASAIVIKPISGGQQLQLGMHGTDLKWSPDGQRLLFLSRSGNVLNLWVSNSSGSDARQLTNEGVLLRPFTVLPYNRIPVYAWSPDSKQVVYVSQQPSGDYQISVISAAGSAESRVLNSSKPEFFVSPLWSPDGKQVLYFSRATAGANWKVLVAELATGSSEIIYQGEHVLRPLGWSGSAGDILIATDERTKGISAKPTEISLFQLSRGKDPRLVARLNSAYFHNIQLSPDGKTIAFASHQDGKDNIWLIPAVGGAARKITANSDPRLYFSSLTWSPDGKVICYGRQSGYSLISEIGEFK